MASLNQEELAAWYARLEEHSEAYWRRCRTYVPDGLCGKRVLDVNCRRGKGAYKFAEAVGESGFVLGCDPSRANVEAAKAGEAKALARAGLASSNMDARVAFPEDLLAVAEEASFDLVYVNNSLNVAFSPDAVLAQAWRVLAPGGTILCATVCADGPRSADVVAAARTLGNSVQAAPALAELLAMLDTAGFANPEVRVIEPILASAGVEEDTVCATVDTSEAVEFSEVLITATKPAV